MNTFTLLLTTLFLTTLATTPTHGSPTTTAAIHTLLRSASHNSSSTWTGLETDAVILPHMGLFDQVVQTALNPDCKRLDVNSRIAGVYMPDNGRWVVSDRYGECPNPEGACHFSVFDPVSPLSIDTPTPWVRASDLVALYQGTDSESLSPISADSFIFSYRNGNSPFETWRAKYTRTGPGTWTKTGSTQVDPTSAGGSYYLPVSADHAVACTFYTEGSPDKTICSLRDVSVWPDVVVGTPSPDLLAEAPVSMAGKARSLDPAHGADNAVWMIVGNDATAGQAQLFLVTVTTPGSPPTVSTSSPVPVAQNGVAPVVSHSSVAALVPDSFAVAWQVTSHPDDLSSTAVLARVFSASGSPLTDEIMVPLDTSSEQTMAGVFALDGDSRAFGVTYFTNNGIGKRPYLATFTLDPTSFDPASSTNTILRLAHPYEIPMTNVPTVIAGSLVANSRDPRFFPALPIDDWQADIRFLTRHASWYYDAPHGHEHSVFRAVSTTLDTARCTTLGQPDFSMACVEAAVAAATHPGERIHLPAGTWTGCLDEGVVISSTLTIYGDGPGLTIVDCAGSGRAFAVRGSLFAPADYNLKPLVVANMTLTGGMVTLAPPALLPSTGETPMGGGCLLVENLLGKGVWVHLQSLVVEGCTVRATHENELNAPPGSKAGEAVGTFLVGGGIAVIDTPDVIVDDVALHNCRVEALGLPPTLPASSRITHLLGGGLGVVFSTLAQAVSPPTVPSDTEYYSRGILLSRITATGNAVVSSSLSAAGGGGGLGVYGIPTWVRGFIVFDVKATGNTADVASGAGGGLLLHTLVRDFDGGSTALGPRLELTANSASGNGGGLALVNLEQSSLGLARIEGVTASGNTAASGGGGLYVVQSTIFLGLDVVETTLSTNRAGGDGGGALLVGDVSVSFLATSDVSSNSATGHGGGMSLRDGSVATLLAGTGVVSNTADQTGGGIAAGGSLFKLSGGVVSGNVAGTQGGALAVSAGILVVESDVVHSGNVAGLSGGGLFECLFDNACGRSEATGCGGIFGTLPNSATTLDVFPVTSVPGSLGNATEIEVLQALFAGNAPNELASDAIEIEVRGAGIGLGGPSGSALLSPLELVRVDRYGNVVGEGGRRVRVESVSSGLLVQNGGSVETGGSGVAVPSAVVLFAAREEDAGASHGVQFVDLSSTCVVSPVVQVQVEACSEDFDVSFSLGLVCLRTCTSGQYMEVQASGETVCKSCGAGMFRTDARHRLTSCAQCKAGTYAFAGAKVCAPCPLGGDCSDPSRVLAKPGFWFSPGVNASSGFAPPSFVECVPAEACLGGETYASCKTGYRSTAFACSGCADQYARGGGKCVACTSRVVSMILVSLLAIVALLVLALSIRSALATVTAMDKERGIRSNVVKTAVNTAQTLGVLASLRAQDSELVTKTLGLSLSWGLPSVDLLPLTCVFDLSVYDVFVLSMMAPAGVALVSAVAFVTWDVLGGMKRGVLSALERSLKPTALVFFLLYPSVGQQAFGMLACKRFSIRDGLWLAKDLEQECWKGRHVTYGMTALAAIAVYVIALPVSLCAYLARVPRVRPEWHFFVGLFDDRMWYWEMITAGRKVVLAAIVVFAARTAEQLGLAIVLLLVVFSLQLWHKPFSIPALNTAEAAGLATCFSFVLTVLISFTAEDGGVAESAGNADPARPWFVSLFEWLCILCVALYFGGMAVFFVWGGGGTRVGVYGGGGEEESGMVMTVVEEGDEGSGYDYYEEEEGNIGGGDETRGDASHHGPKQTTGTERHDDNIVRKDGT